MDNQTIPVIESAPIVEPAPDVAAPAPARALSRLAILEAEDIKTERVYVEEWGGYVLVRGMSAAARDSYEVEVAELKKQGSAAAGRENYRSRLVVRCVVDEEGKRVFSNADAELLGRRSARAVNLVFGVGSRLSGMGRGSVEEAEKNSAAATSGASGSSSPAS